MSQHGTNDSSSSSSSDDLVLHLGHEELVVRQRFETLSIANDVLIGLWFLVGSVLFFSESTATAGTWLFVIGSAQMLIRPVIRLARRLRLQRYRPAGAGSEHAFDF